MKGVTIPAKISSLFRESFGEKWGKMLARDVNCLENYKSNF
jgi:hypothetical protein